LLVAVAALPLIASGAQAGGRTHHHTPGSPAWYETASGLEVATYHEKGCRTPGFKIDTPQARQYMARRVARTLKLPKGTKVTIGPLKCGQ
jgi:hypothetical protein